MYIRDISREKRDIEVEDINGARRLCQKPRFLPSILDHIIPECSSDVPPTATSTTTAPLVKLPTPALITPIAPILVTSETFPSVAVSSIFIPPPSKPTPIIAVPPAVTAPLAIPKSSISIISSSLGSSSIHSIAPVFTSTFPHDTPGSSKSAVASLPAAYSSLVSTSTSKVSATQSSSSLSSTTPLVSVSTTSTTPSSQFPATTSTTTIPPKSITDDSIISPSSHLSTDAKVAIVTAIVFAALALIVGALYILKHRRRVTRARRSAKFAMLTGNDTIGDGNDARQLGPNGYPQDMKMENGKLVPSTQAVAGNQIPPPPISKQGPLYAHGSVITNNENSNNRSTIPEAEYRFGVATTMPMKGKAKVDLVAVPAPATIAVVRAISDSGSTQSAEEKREERINALSMARTLSNGGATSSSRGSWDTPLAINKTKTNTPSSTTSNKSTGTKTSGKEKVKGLKMGDESEMAERVFVAPKFDIKDIMLSKESQELNSLTQEYEAERAKKEKEKLADVQKCMAKDKHTKVQSPTLPVLDSKKTGCAWSS